MPRFQLTLALAIFLTTLVPHYAHAATITFDPQENTVGINAPFTVSIDVDAVHPINTVALTIGFSENFEVIETSDGNSILGMWIDKPIFDATTHTLAFSGIIPGGYSGTHGHLLTMTMRAIKPGVGGIRILTTPSLVYLNLPTPTQDTIVSHTQSIEAVENKTNLANPLLDVSPPEAFVPEVALMPTDDNTQSWSLIFDTTDKGSGIAQAEVREVTTLTPWTSKWHTATSPYTLTDQSLTKRIDIRVYDKKGNVREMSVGPQKTSAQVIYTGILIVLGIIGVLIFRLRRGKR